MKLKVLVMAAILAAGCSDPKPEAGPTDAESLKKSQDEQNAAAARERAAK